MKKLTEDTSFADYEKSKKGEIKKAVKKGKVEHMHVERLDNGFMTTSRHEMPKGDKNMGMMMSERESKHFHMTPEEMGSHHSMMMGGKQLIPVGDGAKEESAAAGAGDPNKED